MVTGYFKKRILTSPYPLQRGTVYAYPPLEGAGGGLMSASSQEK